jgi:hypothetical protein
MTSTTTTVIEDAVGSRDELIVVIGSDPARGAEMPFADRSTRGH